MPEYDDGEIPGDIGWGPIVVRRAVYDAAMALKTEGLPAFEHARLQAETYRAAGEGIAGAAERSGLAGEHQPGPGGAHGGTTRPMSPATTPRRPR